MINEMEFSTYYEVIAFELRDALRRYNEIWLRVLCMDEDQRSFWVSSVEQRRLSVVVLTCCLLENIANFYICTKCKAEHFNKLERWGFVEKWTELPAKFVGNYSLSVHSELGKDLIELRDRRVSIVHPKPMMSIDGDCRHKGNEPAFVLDEHSFIERCSSLPCRLLDHILKFDDAFQDLSSLWIACGGVRHAFDAGQHAIDRVAKVSEELIEEIMSQGLKKETALLCAALIGEFPRAKPDGTIPVKFGEGEIARLKPLKFFSKS